VVERIVEGIGICGDWHILGWMGKEKGAKIIYCML
jgi:hypothetical protein